MKKILFLFVALIMSVASAWAGVNPGSYYIKVYSTGKYLAPTSDFGTSGAPKVVYSDDPVTWEISSGGSTGTNCIGQPGTNRCLNPWSYGSTAAPVGTWGSSDGGVSHGGDNEWVVEQVEGDVYTIKSKSKGCYMWYNSSETNLYYTPSNEGDACKFVFEAVPVTYTINVVGNPSDVTVSYKGAAVEGNTITTTSSVVASDITATNIDGYMYNVGISGTTITVTYSVRSFPDAGTYFVTFTGQASGRKNNLYNDLTMSDGYTVQASALPSPIAEHNNFIWKAVCDGSKMTVVNGQGSTMKLKNGQAATNGATFNTIVYQAHNFGGNTRYYLMPQDVTLGGGHNCLNVAGNGNYLNASGIECLTSWSTTSGPNAGDNHWAVNVVDITGLNEYTVNITGDAPGAYVSYGEQKAANGGFFLAASIAKGDLTANTVSGYETEITVADHTITVVYTLTATPAAVTYNYVIDGETVATETLNTFVDEEFPEPTKNFGGYNRGAKPEGTVTTATETRDITLTWAGPFEPTTITDGELAAGTKWYYMENGNNKGNGYIVYDAASKKSNFSSSSANLPAYKWAFVRKAGTPYFYLYNKATGAVAMGEQLSSNSDYAANHNQGFVVSEGGADMPLEYINNAPGFTLRLAAASGNCILGHHVAESGTYRLSIWGNGAILTDNGSRFVVSEASAIDGVKYTVKVLGATLGVTVKGQNYVDGGETDMIADLAATDVVLATDENYVGSVAINGTNIVVTYHHKGAAIDFAGKKVEVGEKATEIVPDTKWYVLTQLRGGETPTWVNAENKVMRANETAAALFPGKAEELASYLVRFVSTNVDGVYEIQHGNGMYWNTVGANNRKLTASDNVAESKFYFVYGATQSTSGADANGWAMNYTSDFATKADKVDNDGKNSTVGYWASGNTTSGTNNVWYIYETTFSDLPTYDWDEFETKLTKLQQYDFGEGLGKYADVDLSEEFYGSTTASEMITYYVTDLAEQDVDYYDSDMKQMDYILAHLTLNLPKANTFLRIKDADNKYMTCENSSNKTVFSAELNDKSIYCYTGSALIAYTNGFYASRYSNKPCGMTTVTTPSEGTIYHIHASSLNKSKYLVSFGGDTRFMYKGADAGNYAGGPTSVNNAGYEFTLEEVTSLPVSVSAAGYATLYAPVALTVPAGVEAYTLAFDGTYLQATAVEGTIPANTGVVLKANAGSYDFAITTGGNATSVLSGTVPAIAKEDGALVLGLDEENNVGFYSLNGANLAGFKAYYVPANSESNLRISFGELTSIISAAQENGGQAIFDLQGRRVVSAKGLNIVNGKKVIK